MKVLTHETSHILGMRHCIYYSCLMNGANHEGELLAQPLQLCPVCLRKLKEAVSGMNLVKRYAAISQLLDEFGLKEEQKWVDDRLESLGFSQAAAAAMLLDEAASAQVSKATGGRGTCMNNPMLQRRPPVGTAGSGGSGVNNGGGGGARAIATGRDSR